MHEPVRRTLSNGLDVFFAPAPHLHTAALGLYVGVGSRHETPETNGLSHFLEHMLFRGTKRLPSAYALNLAVESIGGSMNGATQADATFFQMTLPPESMLEGAALFGEMLRDPAFDAIDVERDIVCEEILEALDEDGSTTDIDDLSRELLFSPHPLGMKIIGDERNVRRFSEHDLRAHFAAHYHAANMVFVASGAIDPDALLPALEREFGHLPRGTRASITPPPGMPNAPRYAFVDNAGSQSELRVSFVGFGQSDPRRVALDALARIIDDGMSARLHRRICDEKGLAYDVFASLDPYRDTCVFDFGTSVDHGKVSRLLDELLAISLELRDALVPDDELAKMKRRHAWDLRLQLDDALGYGEAIGLSALSGLTLSLGDQRREMEAVTAEQIRDAARAFFRPENLAVSVVGSLERAERDAVLDVMRRYR